MAWTILVLNVLIPGSGTMLYGRIGRGIALLLLALPLLFIPWILSINDGVRILRRATERTPKPAPGESTAPVEAPTAPDEAPVKVARPHSRKGPKRKRP